MGEAAEHLEHPLQKYDRPVLRLVPGDPRRIPPEPEHAASAEPPTQAKPDGKSGAAHWRVDLKWVFGIPFTIVLGLTLVVVAFFSVTSRDNSVDTIAAMQKTLLSRPELVAEINAGAPQLAALINSPDFARLVYEDPAVLDSAIAAIPDASQVAAVAEAQGGPADAASEVGNMKAAVQTYSLPVRFLNAGVHEGLGAVITVQLLFLLLTGIPFLLLSRRTGRLVSPGVSLALASWLPLLVLSFTHQGVLRNIDETQASLGGGEESVVTQAAIDAVRPFVDGAFGPAIATYQLFAFISIGLLTVAGLIYGALRLRGSHSAKTRLVPARSR